MRTIIKLVALMISGVVLHAPPKRDRGRSFASHSGSVAYAAGTTGLTTNIVPPPGLAPLENSTAWPQLGQVAQGSRPGAIVGTKTKLRNRPMPKQAATPSPEVPATTTERGRNMPKAPGLDLPTASGSASASSTGTPSRSSGAGFAAQDSEHRPVGVATSDPSEGRGQSSGSGYKELIFQRISDGKVVAKPEGPVIVSVKAKSGSTVPSGMHCNDGHVSIDQFVSIVVGWVTEENFWVRIHRLEHYDKNDDCYKNDSRYLLELWNGHPYLCDARQSVTLSFKAETYEEKKIINDISKDLKLPTTFDKCEFTKNEAACIIQLITNLVNIYAQKAPKKEFLIQPHEEILLKRAIDQALIAEPGVN